MKDLDISKLDENNFDISIPECVDVKIKFYGKEYILSVGIINVMETLEACDQPSLLTSAVTNIDSLDKKTPEERLRTILG